jgi:BlaI family transcriptional regulator, penicillinase repressor
MAYIPPDITAGELEVLQVLWDRGECSTRQVTDILRPGGGESQYATVQKMLQRLEFKGFVRRDRRLSVHLFAAALSRDEFIDRRLRALARTVCGGSTAPLLTQLVRNKPLSTEERELLRGIIDRPERRLDRAGDQW